MGRDNGFVDRTLANGLRVVIEPMAHVRSAAAGFLVRTGSRDETPALAGVSHFLEHMCFKGTPKRDWRQINIDFDNIGSTYNAYTSKERTFYYGWVRDGDLETQIELLADMMRSVLPPDEFEMERKVILEEIAMSDDQLDRCLYELLHEKVYGGHPLSWPVLGTAETIRALSRDAMAAYFASRYHPANVVLIVAGGVDPNDAIAMAERICSDWTPRSPRPDRAAPAAAPSGKASSRLERFAQQAVALIHPAPSALDPQRETADILAYVLGGHNSRFFWNIVQAGVAPTVSAGRVEYCDNGLMVLWGFSEPDRVEALTEAVRREVDLVVRDGVTGDEVQRVKNRIRTSLATEAESPYYRLSQMVHDVDVFGRPRSVAERLAAVEAVTPGGVAEYLRRWPLDGEAFVVSAGARDWPAI